METLVAITVLIVAIVGPLYAVHKSITASYAARDKLIATALAQEGLEYVRSVRDNNYLALRTWTTTLSNCFNYNCHVDPGQNIIARCPGNSCNPLNISAADLYTQIGGTPTRFTRSVRITSITANEIRVEVRVTWMTSRIPYTVTISEHLYNWL